VGLRNRVSVDSCYFSLLELLPQDADILCTHPMFGPESGRYSWKGLPFVYEQVRISDQVRCETFLGIFSSALCTMIPMSSELHDSYAASSQFITHTTGKLVNVYLYFLTSYQRNRENASKTQFAKHTYQYKGIRVVVGSCGNYLQ
jgi:prephenate dehydrogenase